MDSKLYEALITSNIANLHELATSDQAALLQVTTDEDNVLHVAAKYKLNKKAKEIATKYPQLMSSLATRKNSKGDTPLHVAARLGSFETAAEILVNCGNGCEIEAGQRVTKMVNAVNDTALHDAVRNGHARIAELLIREDPELTDLINGDGESPLFIAVDKKYVCIAECILQVAPGFSFAGRNKMNALHAAVVRSQDQIVRLSSHMVKLRSPMKYLTNMSFKHYFKFFAFAPSAIIRAALQNQFSKEFVVLLTRKCQAALSETDDFGWTPLHYAVHFGDADILNEFMDHIDSSIAAKRDKQGMSVVHIAAREGEASILEVLVNKFPEIWDLQDNKGRTAFHLAVETGKLDCAKFILGTEFSHDGLINQQDNDGNTALHLATIHGHDQNMFELLLKDCRVDKTARNFEGLTVLDIILMKEYGYFEMNWKTMSLATNGGLESLEHAMNKNGRKTRPIESTTNQKHSQQPETTSNPANIEARSQQRSDQLKNIASINLLVMALIATVSFAAGFTVPGGYKSDAPEGGMAVLSRKLAFRAFVIANALAFCFSTTSMFLHYCKSFVEKPNVQAFYTYITLPLTNYGITAMVIAFVSGTYATLADTPGLAKAVLCIGCSFFGLQLLVYFK